jgi:hypothetical protein
MMIILVLLDSFRCPNTDFTLENGLDELGFMRLVILGIFANCPQILEIVVDWLRISNCMDVN